MPHRVPLFVGYLSILLLPDLGRKLPLITLRTGGYNIRIITSGMKNVGRYVKRRGYFGLSSGFDRGVSAEVIRVLDSGRPMAPLSPIFS